MLKPHPSVNRRHIPGWRSTRNLALLSTTCFAFQNITAYDGIPTAEVHRFTPRSTAGRVRWIGSAVWTDFASLDLRTSHVNRGK